MGKAQSKRSVDITTDVKKGTDDEVTEKLEKIEDVDQKQINGDAAAKEINEAEKKDSIETENDKDLTTEKNETVNEENADQTNDTATDTPKVETGATEEITPLADDSVKKSKKEKVKKKWSFRSISFGKKDKQKPAKTEDSTENPPTANGESEKVDSQVEDNATVEKSSEEACVKPADSCENGQATEKELNGEQSPTPTEENKSANEKITATVTATAVASAVSSAIESNGTAIENNQTEIKENADINSSEKIEMKPKPDSEKNGIELSAVVNDVQETCTDKMGAAEIDVSVNAAIENNKIISSELNDGHVADENSYQNGTNGEAELDADMEPIKSQIEVNIDTKNTAEANLITINTHAITTTTTITTNTILPESTNISNNEKILETTEEIVVENDIPVVSELSTMDVDDSKIIQNEIESQMQEPPPLPISPPPSQISVFAFNNDNLVTIPQEEENKNSMPLLSGSLIGESDPIQIECNSMMNDVMQSSHEQELKPLNESDIVYDQTESQIKPLNDTVNINDCGAQETEKKEIEDLEAKLDLAVEEKSDIPIQLFDNLTLESSSPKLIESITQLDEVKKLHTKLIEEEDTISNEKLNSENVINAINDGTDDITALMISQKQEIPTEVEAHGENMPIMDDIMSHDIIEKTTTLITVEVAGEENGNNIDIEQISSNNVSEENKMHNLNILNDNSNIENDNANVKDNITTFDDASAKKKMQIENFMLNEDNEENLNNTPKNIVNAKDLKENTTADIITQDISVTNE